LSTIIVGSIGLALAAQAHERQLSYQSLVHLIEIEKLRLLNHREGWSDDAWGHVREAAKFNRGAGALKNQAVASLIGIDGTMRKPLKNPCTSLTFSPSGKELFVVGEDGRTRAWDSRIDQVRDLDHVGTGIVAFRDEITPVQFEPPSPGDDKGSVSLWDLNQRALIRRFKVPAADGSEVKAVAITHGGGH